MKKQKTSLKSNKGITLIALIITIIVLLILATVSIKLVMYSGIIKHAENATNKYQVEEEKEKIGLGYTEYQIAKTNNENADLTVEGATVTGNEETGWTITFDKTGNRYKLDSQGKSESKPKTEEELLLEKYFLGNNEQGVPKTIEDVIDVADIEKIKFKDNAILPDGSKVLTFLNFYDDETHVYVLAQYEKKVYKLQINHDNMQNQTVEFVYEPQGREGKKVKYSYDGKPENEKDWTILYDYGDTVEIISPDALGNLMLGRLDEQTTGVDNAERAMNSYNNALKRINEYTSSLITNSNKISVRNVGSNPNNPQAEGKMYKSEDLDTWAEGKYNGKVRSADINLEQDLIRLNYLGVAEVTNIYEYWLTSRSLIKSSSYARFSVNYMVNGICADDCLWSVSYTGTVSGNSYSHAVRPVVKVDSSKVTIVE